MIVSDLFFRSHACAFPGSPIAAGDSAAFNAVSAPLGRKLCRAGNMIAGYGFWYRAIERSVIFWQVLRVTCRKPCRTVDRPTQMYYTPCITR